MNLVNNRTQNSSCKIVGIPCENKDIQLHSTTLSRLTDQNQRKFCGSRDTCWPKEVSLILLSSRYANEQIVSWAALSEQRMPLNVLSICSQRVHLSNSSSSSHRSPQHFYNVTIKNLIFPLPTTIMTLSLHFTKFICLSTSSVLTPLAEQ